MQKKIFIRVAILTTGLIAASPLVFAQGAADNQTMMPGSASMMGPGMGAGGGMMGPGMGAGSDMMGGQFGFGPIEALNLSPDQQRKINSIRDDLRKQHWSLLGQIQDQQAVLRDLYAADQIDQKKVSEAYNKIGSLQAQMGAKHAQALNEARNVLTPEQRQQLAQIQRGYTQRGYGAPGSYGGGMMGR